MRMVGRRLNEPFEREDHTQRNAESAVTGGGDRTVAGHERSMLLVAGFRRRESGGARTIRRRTGIVASMRWFYNIMR